MIWLQLEMHKPIISLKEFHNCLWAESSTKITFALEFLNNWKHQKILQQQLVLKHIYFICTSVSTCIRSCTTNPWVSGSEHSSFLHFQIAPRGTVWEIEKIATQDVGREQCVYEKAAYEQGTVLPLKTDVPELLLPLLRKTDK